MSHYITLTLSTLCNWTRGENFGGHNTTVGKTAAVISETAVVFGSQRVTCNRRVCAVRQ